MCFGILSQQKNDVNTSKQIIIANDQNVIVTSLNLIKTINIIRKEKEMSTFYYFTELE